MAKVSRSVTLNGSLADVWGLIGNFQGLGDWHPAVESVTKEDVGGTEHRRIALKGGGEILEMLHGSGDGHYSYTIVESPLPVSGYLSMISAAEKDGKTVVTWGSTFEPTADGAEDAVAGIYEAGFGALTERFGS